MLPSAAIRYRYLDCPVCLELAGLMYLRYSWSMQFTRADLGKSCGSKSMLFIPGIHIVVCRLDPQVDQETDPRTEMSASHSVDIRSDILVLDEERP